MSPPTRGDRWSFLARPGAWFWVALALGAALRIALALGTPGSDDVALWSKHAEGVARRGVVRQYFFSELFNHPPPIGWAMGRLWELAVALGVSFGVLLRVCTSAIDLGNVALIAALLRESRWRWLAAACYALSPVAIVLSGQHGNTDVAVATCLLGATLWTSRSAPVRAGVVIGVSAWLKIAALFAAPAFGFAFARWRDRFVCASVALVVAGAPFAYAFVAAETRARERAQPVSANPVWHNVFEYRGIDLPLPGATGQWQWGLQNLSARAFGPDPARWPAPVSWWHEHAVAFALALMLAFAFLRRRERTLRGVATTVVATYAIFFALADDVATQYFAWTAALWLFAGWRWALASHAAVGAYTYWFYAISTNDPWLRGSWMTFIRAWPDAFLALRDAAQLLFVVYAVASLSFAVRDELRFWRERRAAVEVRA